MTESFLHMSSLDPEESWPRQLACACGAQLAVESKKCPGCRRKNPVANLHQKRQRLDPWFEKQHGSRIQQMLNDSAGMLSAVRNFENILREVAARPFPERTRKEDFRLFVRRVARHFPALFTSTSPSKMVRRMDDQLRRAATDMSQKSGTLAQTLLREAGARFSLQTPGEELSDEVHQDLVKASLEYIQALKTLKMYHDRLTAAWLPVKEIFARTVNSRQGQSLWRKAKGKFQSAGTLLKFSAAIWDDKEELANLQKFDGELLRFVEQVGRFLKQNQQFQLKQQQLFSLYAISLRRFVHMRLLAEMGQAPSHHREYLACRLLGQKGISSWLTRWYWRGKARKALG